MKKPNIFLPITLTALAVTLLTGCLRTTHEIKPIHITLDINLKVDKALDDFFGDIDSTPVTPAPIVTAPNTTAPVVTAPATQTSDPATLDTETN